MLQKIVRWIAGVSPASGCTQPPTSKFISQQIFLFALRQIAGGTPANLYDRFFVTKIVSLVPVVHLSQLSTCPSKIANT
ncbi:MAG: hypothetical protein LBP59_13570 [Planctomycetaceae bacterium]|nr:hypothetical protein [Planctomycetaceae bacterium]